MSVRPRVAFQLESGWAQIGEPCQLVADCEDGELHQPWFPDAGGATITIETPGGGDLSTPVEDAVMTIAGARVSYTIPLATFASSSPDRNFRAVVKITKAPDTWEIPHFFDVVRFSPRIPIRLADLEPFVPGFERMDPAEDPSNEKIMRLAWREVLGWLSDVDIYPDLIIDSKQLERGFIWKFKQLLHERRIRQEGDQAWVQAELARQGWTQWTRSTLLVIDRNETGRIDADEEDRKGMASAFIGRRVAGDG